MNVAFGILLGIYIYVEMVNSYSFDDSWSGMNVVGFSRV